MREMAYIEIETEPVVDDATAAAAAEYDESEQAAADGRWEDAGLDELPDGWQPATIEDLRGAGE